MAAGMPAVDLRLLRTALGFREASKSGSGRAGFLFQMI